jgi:hypothetical protein
MDVIRAAYAPSIVLFIPFILVALAAIAILLRRKAVRGRSVPTIGFFHPFTVDGGGGERVLWYFP